MERREFLERSLKATAAMLLLQGFSPAGKLFAAKLSESTLPGWKELVDFARWSPSPHNVQPWKLKVLSPTEAELYCDPKRLLHETDPSSCFTIIGMAMFIECMTVAAAQYGCAVSHELAIKDRIDYNNDRLQLFAKLRLEAKTAVLSHDRNLVLQRKTSRLHYNGKAVEEAVMQKLSELASAYGQQLNYSSEHSMINWVMDLNRQTLFDDLKDEKCRKELRGLIRTSDKEAREKKDGLWSKCMRFPGWLMESFFDHNERYNHGKKKEIMEKIYVNSMKGTRTIAWISGNFETPEHWMKCGAMLQGLWLEMTKHNVVLHPFGSVITNPAAHARLKERIGGEKNGQKLWLLMRMGYSDEAPRSLRLETNEIIIT